VDHHGVNRISDWSIHRAQSSKFLDEQRSKSYSQMKTIPLRQRRVDTRHARDPTRRRGPGAASAVR
jgi:hypothetical protein